VDAADRDHVDVSADLRRIDLARRRGVAENRVRG